MPEICKSCSRLFARRDVIVFTAPRGFPRAPQLAARESDAPPRVHRGVRVERCARASPPSALGCSTFLVGKDASSDGSLFVTHSDDGEGNPDARLSYVPPADHAPGSMRPVWPDLEDNPRYVGDHRGDTYLPGVSVPPDTPPTEPIGHIPQVPHTFGYSEGNYGIMNEHQLSIGESTCSGRFVASAISAGGEALFCVNELSRVAMERCSTARCAISRHGRPRRRARVLRRRRFL